MILVECSYRNTEVFDEEKGNILKEMEQNGIRFS